MPWSRDGVTLQDLAPNPGGIHGRHGRRLGTLPPRPPTWFRGRRHEGTLYDRMAHQNDTFKKTGVLNTHCPSSLTPPAQILEAYGRKQEEIRNRRRSGDPG